MPSSSASPNRWTRQSSAEIAARFAQQRRADPFGLRLHLWAGVIACFSAALPTAFVTWGALPLMLVWLVRMWTHHRILGPLWWDSTARAAAAWSAWLLLTLLWSGDSRAGLEEAHVLAFLLLIPALYPVLDRAPVLMAALGAGFVLSLGVQGLHALDVAVHAGMKGESAAPTWINWGRLPGRLSGWWDPVVGGSLLCGFLGVAIGVAARARAAARRVGAALVVLMTLAGILATGTRGAWIGGAITLGIGVLITLWCWMNDGALGRATPRRRAAIVLSMLVALSGIAGAGVLAVWKVPPLRARFDEGRREVRETLQRGDYTSFTGARLAMWEWAMAAWRCHPIVGVGAGGYQAWVREQTALALDAEQHTGPNATRARPCLPREKLGPIVAEPIAAPASDSPHIRARPMAREIVHAHAHGLWPHVAATAGTVGVVVLAWLLLGPVVRVAHECVRRGSRAEQTDQMKAPCAMGLLGLLAAGLFDSISVNQQTWYLACVLLALGVSAGAPARAVGQGKGGTR